MSKNTSGFEEIGPISEYKPCTCREHYPPDDIRLKPGFIYKYTCPECGHATMLVTAEVTLEEGQRTPFAYSL